MSENTGEPWIVQRARLHLAIADLQLAFADSLPDRLWKVRVAIEARAVARRMEAYPPIVEWERFKMRARNRR